MSQRLEKINELIHHKLSEIISKELEFPINSLVTITRVETSPDIKYGKVYISVLPDNMRGSCLKIFKKNSHRLHKILKKEMLTKFTPNLKFLIDEQEIFATKVENLLDEINKG